MRPKTACSLTHRYIQPCQFADRLWNTPTHFSPQKSAEDLWHSNTKLTIYIRTVPVLRMWGGVPPFHCHLVAVRVPHVSAGPGYAAVTPVTITGHLSVAVACRWCDIFTVPPRPLYIPTLHNYAPLSTVKRFLPWHNVRYSNSFRVSIKLRLWKKSLLFLRKNIYT
jgi:hypothetical protein